MLHGEIKVNDVTVGEWSAVRKAEHEGFAEYECRLLYRNVSGYLQEAQWTLRGHAVGNGPISLGARVLQEGMTILGPAVMIDRNMKW